MAIHVETKKKRNPKGFGQTKAGFKLGTKRATASSPTTAFGSPKRKKRKKKNKKS